MKRLMLIAAIALSAASVQAQKIGDMPISELDSEYIQLVGTAKLFKLSEVNIEVEYGQGTHLKNLKAGGLFDENGKQMTLNSMIDALNFFAKYGYEFIDAYTITLANQNVYHFLMKKKQ